MFDKTSATGGDRRKWPPGIEVRITLRYVIARTGQDAAYEVIARDVPLEAVATTLSTVERGMEARPGA
ncbi:hypothetical protein [Streptomyces sp. A0592]|uniref:hypothetical protein n=1 Tax=Streptomyces sp. A0592 TaxID=2563099 RepID=UPI00109E3862|nr:hypothetical protein [Streptomyces sp. A0592]THA78690.1 hypothetical protein E6U81_33250 [Streptomyces sp. A0592]